MIKLDNKSVSSSHSMTGIVKNGHVKHAGSDER
jgi:hypothetical protein